MTYFTNDNLDNLPIKNSAILTERPTRKFAALSVTFQVLENLLELDPSAQITHISVDHTRGVLTAYYTDPQASVPEGQEIPINVH